MKENSPSSAEKGNLIIVPTTGKPLTKSQDRFNALTQNIENLEKRLAEKETFLENLLHYFSKKIHPLIEVDARNKIKIAFLVEEKMLSVKLSRIAQNQAEELIVFLLRNAFISVEPNKDEIALYNRFSEVSYEEEKTEELQRTKAEMQSMLAQQGIAIDLTNVDIEDEIVMARLRREIQDKLQIKEKEIDAETTDAQDKKKTKKEKYRDALNKIKEQVQSKSLKSIYISLSKALHPDTESNVELKHQKAELMKKVTVAYQEKNFTELLALEMEWIYQTTKHLQALSEDKLQLYIDILLDRENELQEEMEKLERDPKFYQVRRFANLNEKSAYKKIDQTKKAFASNQEFYTLLARHLSNARTKQDVAYLFEDMYVKIVETV